MSMPSPGASKEHKSTQTLQWKVHLSSQDTLYKYNTQQAVVEFDIYKGEAFSSMTGIS